jgi:hypothetical protein
MLPGSVSCGIEVQASTQRSGPWPAPVRAAEAAAAEACVPEVCVPEACAPAALPPSADAVTMRVTVAATAAVVAVHRRSAVVIR